MIGSLGAAVLGALAGTGERGEAAEQAFESLLPALVAEAASSRSRAAAALEALVVDPAGLDAVLVRLPELPLEARARVRATIATLPATGPGLVRRARRGDAAAQAMLEELLLAEIARRLDREDLVEEPLERGALEPGVVVGIDWPFGPALRLDEVIAALCATVDAAKPVALSPAVDAVSPVEAIELLPTTASALLHRLLAARGLAVVDAGLVFLVVDAATEAAREELLEPEEPEDDGAPRIAPVRADSWAARYLTAQLTGDADEGARQALLVALGLAAAADGLPPLDPRATAAEVTPWLGGDVEPALRTVMLLALRDRGAALVELVPGLLAHDDPERRLAGAWLAAAGRVDAAFEPLAPHLADPVRDVAVASALARARLRPFDDAVGRELVETLGAGVTDRLLRPALEVAEWLSRAGGGAGRLDAGSLLAASDPGARAVGAALLAFDGAAGPRAARLLPVRPPRAAEAFAVALARGGGPAPAVPVLLERRGRSRAAAASLAWLLGMACDEALVGRSWVAAAERAGRAGDAVELGMLRVICAADMTRDEDYRPGRLRTALRPHSSELATKVAVEELWKALVEEDRGQDLRRLGAASLPW